MNMRYNILLVMFCAVLGIYANVDSRNGFRKENVSIVRAGDKLVVSMDMILDGTRLGSNKQLFVTPVIMSADSSKTVVMPTVLFSGRNMHYVYLRSGQKALPNTNYNIIKEVYHKSGTVSTVNYNQATDLQKWMTANNAVMRLVYDTCGCGNLKSKGVEDTPLCLNPASRMLHMAYPVPVVGDDKIQVHQGRTKVQFEVNKFELHDQVYKYTNRATKRSHTIDNRQQLKTIDDSIRYALSSPNVELVSLEICGYASPESPYEHNEYLATNRAQAVMMYVQRHDNVPAQKCTYQAVPENWNGFRQQVLDAQDITEQQRKDLLELIDRTVHTSSDYDKKESELKTSPAFADVYRNKIHPDWFPELRYTEFTIRTHLKPMTDEQLCQVMLTDPERLSLSQFYRVALSYGHGTQGFHDALCLALKYYPKDPTANANAAALAIEQENYEEAKSYLLHAGDSDDANIMRGIVATNDGDIDKACEYFNKAIKQPEAQRNLELIQH